MTEHDGRIEVVQACRILVDLRLDSGPFGNISVRVPGREEYWQNPVGIHFDRIQPRDVLRVNREGEVLEGDHPPHPGEFIHRQIYQLRPDVGAIVHTHSTDTVLFSLLGCEIAPLTQLGASLYDDQGIYQGFSGPVRSSEEGRAIATALGHKSIVIAKNHGLFAAANNIRAALWDMVVADKAACIHLRAMGLGVKIPTTVHPEIVEKSRREVRDRQCDAVWKNYLQGIE